MADANCPANPELTMEAACQSAGTALTGENQNVAALHFNAGLVPICPARPRKLGLMIGQAAPGPPESLPPGYMPFDGPPGMRLAKLGGYVCTEHLWAEFDRIDLVACAPVRKFRLPHHGVETGYRKHNWDGHVFPRLKAKLAANQLLQSGRLMCDYVLVVLCGKKVAHAFGLDISREQPYAQESYGISFLVMPHPSGVSHLWNDEVFWPRAAGFFRAYLKAARAMYPAGSYVQRRRRRITNKRAPHAWESTRKQKKEAKKNVQKHLDTSSSLQTLDPQSVKKSVAVKTSGARGVPRAQTTSEERALLNETPDLKTKRALETQPDCSIRSVVKSRFF